MAGRYSGELSVRIAGNRDAAPAYLPAARLLMGEVLEQAEVNNLGTHLLRRQLDDGTVLVAEKIGDLNRVTIAAPGQAGRLRPVRVFDDLVVTAGGDEWDSAGKVKYPPVLMSHDDETRWRSYFASANAPGFNSAAGTYSDAFTLANENANSLRVGNCAHVNSDGVAVSWWGSAFCVAEPMRNPNAMYGGVVFCVGKIIFNVDHPDAMQSSGYSEVLAAAIDDGNLLVVVASLGALLFAPRPSTPERNFDAWVSPPFSDAAHPTALFRFKLNEKTDPTTFQTYYEVDYGSESLLWAGSLVRGYNRWTFDPGAHEFVSVQLPANAVMLYRGISVGVEGPVEPLSNEEAIFRLSASGLTTEPAGDVIFESAGQQVALELVGEEADFVTPGRRIPALRHEQDATSDVRTYTILVHADMANDRYILCHRQITAAASPPGIPTSYTEVCWYSAVDSAGDTPFGETFQRVGSIAFMDDYQLAISAYLNDLAASGSGVSRFCHSACGWVHGVMMAMGFPMSIPWHEGYSVYGVRAGAASYTDTSRDVYGEPPVWGYTEYYGAVPNTSPQYDLALKRVYSNLSATSTERYAAAHVSVAGSYLTNGNMDQQLNGAFADFMIHLCPLGAPLKTQKRERPA